MVCLKRCEFHAQFIDKKKSCFPEIRGHELHSFRNNYVSAGAQLKLELFGGKPNVISKMGIQRNFVLAEKSEAVAEHGPLRNKRVIVQTFLCNLWISVDFPHLDSGPVVNTFLCAFD